MEQEQAPKPRRILPANTAYNRTGVQIVAARAKLLLVRRKIESRHPEVPAEVLKDIEKLHREALEELSNGR